MIHLISTLFQDEPLTLFFIIGIVILWIWLLHAIYFYIKYQKPMEKNLMGEDYYSGGFLYDGLRVMMYGHYLLFPKRAKKAGVYDFFSKLNNKLKAHLLFHWFGLVIGGITALIPAIILYFYS